MSLILCGTQSIEPGEQYQWEPHGWVGWILAMTKGMYDYDFVWGRLGMITSTYPRASQGALCPPLSLSEHVPAADGVR